jgi:hypothetical protein
MEKQERETIEHRADMILNALESRNLVDMPISEFSRMLSEFHALATILDNQVVPLKKGKKKIKT